MPNKVLRLLFLSVPLPVTLAGTCITAGTPSICYAATTDTEKGVINIAQSVSAVRSESEEQNYTFSYSAYDPATYDGKVGFSIRFDKGFYPRSLNLGDWTDYKGELSIEVYHEKNFLGKETVSPGNEVDMTKYEGCDMIRILYGEEETNSVKNFTGMILSGEIHASESDEKLLVSADCFGTNAPLFALYNQVHNYMIPVCELDNTGKRCSLYLEPRDPFRIGFRIGYEKNMYVLYQYLDPFDFSEDEELWIMNGKEPEIYLKEIDRISDCKSVVKQLCSMANRYADDLIFTVPLSFECFTETSNVKKIGKRIYFTSGEDRELFEKEKKNLAGLKGVVSSFQRMVFE